MTARFQMTSGFAVFRARLAKTWAREAYSSLYQPALHCHWLVCSFPRAAITYLHKLSDLNQQNVIFSWSGSQSSKSRCWQDSAPSEGSKENPFLPPQLLAIGHHWCSLEYSCLTLISACTFTYSLFLPCGLYFPLIR